LLTLTVSMSGSVPSAKVTVSAIAAVIAAARLHVDHLVDADDLRLERLGDGRLDHGGRGAGEVGRHLDLRRHDVGELRHRDAQDREQPGERHQDGDDDRQPRPVDEDTGDHRPAISRRSGRWRSPPA
jgi:hypothetical protein